MCVATGGGRNGKAGLNDGSLDIKMGAPKELGGKGDGHNPEQLFAIGYAACFLGAFRLAASRAHIKLPDETTVESHVKLGPHDLGFAIAVDLHINVPGKEAEKDAVEAAVLTAHNEICPYANATRGNVDVQLSVTYA
ncbi:OsmC-like protein [Calocera cornea HHB12733]|uniref:OsmC-like protein n=1 Tax=Calocera cornea HHB12733 TaxID=1353952 RepID=A0A165FU11_9BASI|nr:OsmC-like protein [Calocera cornea HHB12733]